MLVFLCAAFSTYYHFEGCQGALKPSSISLCENKRLVKWINKSSENSTEKENLSTGWAPGKIDTNKKANRQNQTLIPSYLSNEFSHVSAYLLLRNIIFNSNFLLLVRPDNLTAPSAARLLRFHLSWSTSISKVISCLEP